MAPRTPTPTVGAGGRKANNTIQDNSIIAETPVSVQQEIELLQREVDRLRPYEEFANNAKRLLTSNLPQSAKLMGVGLHLDALDHPTQGDGATVLHTTQEEWAKKYRMSERTVGHALKVLDKVGVTERHAPRILKDREGRELDPRQTDPRREGVWWSRETSTILRPLPPLPEKVEPTEYQTKTRVRARDRVNRLVEAALQERCPRCGSTGTLSVVCSCGLNLTTGEVDGPTRKVCGDPATEALSGPGNQGDGKQAAPAPAPLSASLPAHIEGRSPEAQSLRLITEEPQSLRFGTKEVKDWLTKRIGQDARLIRQVNLPGKKYLPFDGTPDLDGYLRGDPGHVYGSRMKLENGLTRVLSFDFDNTGHEPPLEAARQLAEAGAWAFYWERGDGGHLELYFDRPVHPEAARQWATNAAPALLASSECYPARGQGDQWKDKSRQGLSWPLVRLDGQRVVSCPLWSFGPGGEEARSPGWLEDSEGIKAALTQSLTPASLIPAPTPVESAKAVEPATAVELHPAPARATSTTTPARVDGSLVREAIAWWNATHDERDVFGRELGDREYFKVREERTPSTCRDRDGRGTYMDYGTGKKYDLFELYCIFKGRDKREAIRRVVDEYLQVKGKRPVTKGERKSKASVSEPAAKRPIEKPYNQREIRYGAHLRASYTPSRPARATTYAGDDVVVF